VLVPIDDRTSCPWAVFYDTNLPVPSLSHCMIVTRVVFVFGFETTTTSYQKRM